MRNCNHGNTKLWCCRQTMGHWRDVFKLSWRATSPPVSVNARPSLRCKTHVKTVLANDRWEDPRQINPSLALFFFCMCSFCSWTLKAYWGWGQGYFYYYCIACKENIFHFTDNWLESHRWSCLDKQEKVICVCVTDRYRECVLEHAGRHHQMSFRMRDSHPSWQTLRGLQEDSPQLDSLVETVLGEGGWHAWGHMIFLGFGGYKIWRRDSLVSTWNKVKGSLSATMFMK